MTDELRRQDDRLLRDIDKRLALLEQARELEGKAAIARSLAHDNAIAGLSTKLDSVITLWQAVTSEPGGSPAGRAIVAELQTIKIEAATLEIKVDEHETFISEAKGAMRLARFALAAALSALGVSVLQVIAMWSQGPKP
jgi:hypothetical protein